jgi:DNA-binding NarL/FixJ family response regulator
MITVLLVDDHAVVRAGYRRFLEHEQGIRVAAEAGSAEEGYTAFCRLGPEVSVIDLSLPGMGGLELVRRIVRREPAARTIAFSMHEESLLARRALQAGARAYVTKASAPDTLVEAVRRVHAGRTFLSPDMAHKLALEGAGAGDPLAELTPKEFEVFRLLAQGLALAEIATALKLSLKTVANYQSQVRDKLGVATGAALVHLAARRGLVRTAPPD